MLRAALHWSIALCRHGGVLNLGEGRHMELIKYSLLTLNLARCIGEHVPKQPLLRLYAGCSGAVIAPVQCPAGCFFLHRCWSTFL